MHARKKRNPNEPGPLQMTTWCFLFVDSIEQKEKACSLSNVRENEFFVQVLDIEQIKYYCFFSGSVTASCACEKNISPKPWSVMNAIMQTIVMKCMAAIQADYSVIIYGGQKQKVKSSVKVKICCLMYEYKVFWTQGRSCKWLWMTVMVSIW